MHSKSRTGVVLLDVVELAGESGGAVDGDVDDECHEVERNGPEHPGETAPH